MAWDTVKTTDIAKPLPLAERRREISPTMFFYLPPTTIAIHSTNPSGSRSQGSHSYAVPGMRCTGQSKEDVVLRDEGTHFLVKSTLSAKVRGYAVSHSSAQGCQCLSIMSRTKLCIFSKICKAPPGCTLLSSLTSLVPLLVTGSLLSLEYWVLACPCSSILHISMDASCPTSQSPRLSTT